MDHRFTALEIRRAFTVFQLMTILEENRHTLMILEHDPLLYEDAKEMVEYISRAMREAAKSSIVLLYSPASDPFLEEIMKMPTGYFAFPKNLALQLGLLQRTAEKRRVNATLEAF